MKPKRLQPNLIDPIIGKKIVKTLNPPIQDYWKPTKMTFLSFYQDYIKPNIYLVIFICIILILLLYRYRVIQTERENNEHMSNIENNTATNIVSVTTPTHSRAIVSVPKPKVSVIQKEHANALLQLYDKQKEDSRDNETVASSLKKFKYKKPRLAYPMYPYTKGGSLVPAAAR